MLWELLLLPISGALIGWGTNLLAIRMLFWPRTPWRVPGTPWTLMGLLPRRKADLAKSVGQVVEDDLLTPDDIVSMVHTQAYRDQLVGAVTTHVDQRLRALMPILVPGLVREHMLRTFTAAVKKELTLFLENLSEDTLANIRQEFNLGQQVEQRIRSLDLNQLESLIRQIAARELRHIEFLGALLGGFIGTAQAVLVLWRLG